MKPEKKSALLRVYLIAGVFLVLLTAGEALGAENGSGWRETYDIVMRWVNFGILVFLFIKFVKKPLMNFLHARGDGLKKDITDLENEKKKAETKSRETLELIERGEAHIEKIKEKIIKQGKDERGRIINEARTRSQYMLEETKKRVGSHIFQARRDFRAELVDAAIALAMEKLPQMITEKDNQNFIGGYLKSLK
ncbi:MAG: ATP synthase F0 subunit B [Desulfobacterales bacterium]